MVAPVVIGARFIVAVSLFKEPNRRDLMAIMIAGAGAASSAGCAISDLVIAA